VSTVVEEGITRDVLKEDLDLLILQITLNDAEPGRLSPEERKRLFEAPWLHSGIWKAWKTIGLIGQRIHNSQTVNRYIDYHTKYFKDPETYRAFSDALGSIAQRAKNAGVPLLAVVFPLFDLPINERYPLKRSHTLIARALKRHDIPGVDLRSAYENIPPERLQVIPNQDNHPNEIAHRIAAERLLAYLIANKLVPANVVPTRVYSERDQYRSKSLRSTEIFDIEAQHIALADRNRKQDDMESH
jgi:hypothetical protein